MIHAALHASTPLLPLDQQLVTVDLPGRRLLARVLACDEAGRLSFLLFDPEPALQAVFERSDAIHVEYVKVGLCRARFTTLRVEDSAQSRTPLLLVHGMLGRVESLQRRDNFRVRVSLLVELLVLKGSTERPEQDTPSFWWTGRCVNASAEGLCVEVGRTLFRGDVISVRLHTDERVIEADARVIGPRPIPGAAHLSHYGVQLIQIPRADQQCLVSLVRSEEQRGLAYRIGR